MGSCTRRHFLLSTCFLQMITIIERQVFDFLGYMWAPIFVNFFHIIFVIFGFYGAYHFRIKYTLTYLIWNFLWIGWNTFLICFYLNVGTLDRDSDLLNLGTGSFSWFEVNGYDCKPIYPVNITSDDPYRPIRPERVDDCLLDYTIVEVIHSGAQCILAFFGIIGAVLISYLFLDEDDRLKHVNKNSKHRQSLYSIEFSRSIDTLRSRTDTILDYDEQFHERDGNELCPKPMTPRRVKRRSVMARGCNNRISTTSRHSAARGAANESGSSSGTHSRNSMRSSRRKYQQNPVTKFLDQQQQELQQQHYQTRTHAHHNQHAATSVTQNNKPQFASFHHHKDNSALTISNLQTLNQDLVKTGSTHDGSLTKMHQSNNNSHYHSFQRNIPPDPIYYNTNGQAGLFPKTWRQSLAHSPTDEPPSPTTPTLVRTDAVAGGHYNPTYQHSNTNLAQDAEHVDVLYNNRPPSVRSSYSNFHGTRPLSSAYFSSTASSCAAVASKENLFAELPGASQQQLTRHIAPSTPPLYQQHPMQHQHSKHSGSEQYLPLPSPTYSSTTVPQVIPFGKRSASRESIRSMAFLNSGPPAYNLNYHTPPDSETTM